MSLSGLKGYSNLELYFIDNGGSAGVTKPNSISDPDYVAPVYDPIFCPPPSVSPTPSITPSLTPSVTPSITPSITVTPSVTPSITVTPSVTLSVSVSPSITPSISLTPSVTPTPPTSQDLTPNIINISTFVYNCSGFNYLGYTIDLDKPAVSNISYQLFITYNISGIINDTYAFGDIYTGEYIDTRNYNPCSNPGYGIPLGTALPTTVTYVCIEAVAGNVNNLIGLC